MPNTASDLNDYGAVGICAFTWVKNVNTSPTADWTDLSNITTYQQQALFAAPQPAAFFTGVSTDTNYVYVVGRNKGSGTRANVMADSGVGITTSVHQYSIGGGVTNSATTTLLLAPVGNNGYESGGGVAAALGINGSCGQTDPISGYPAWLAVGYLGCSDAVKSGLTVANNWLTENGVLESNGAIIEGRYSYWGNEHVYGKHGISGYQDTVGTKLATALTTSLNNATLVLANHDAGIGLNYMHCEKVSDTAFPTRK